MPVRIVATSRTDPGVVRERNEDSALIRVVPGPQEDMALLIVADGMGGYKAGDRASQLAVETIRIALEPLFNPATLTPTIKLKTTPDDDRPTVVLPETQESKHIGEALIHAVRQANDVIVDYGRDHREARGLGSTVTLAMIVRNRGYFANVGDSRTYLFRSGVLRAITRDHSLVARLVEDGNLDPDDVYSHPKRNLIYRSLGSANEEVEVDLFEEDLQPGDMVLLCSDGLWEKVRSPEIVSLLQSIPDLDSLCQLLIKRANDHGGEDNITVVVARCLDEPERADAPKPAEADPSKVETNELPAISSAEGDL